MCLHEERTARFITNIQAGEHFQVGSDWAGSLLQILPQLQLQPIFTLKQLEQTTIGICKQRPMDTTFRVGYRAELPAPPIHRLNSMVKLTPLLKERVVHPIFASRFSKRKKHLKT